MGRVCENNPCHFNGLGVCHFWFLLGDLVAGPSGIRDCAFEPRFFIYLPYHDT